MALKCGIVGLPNVGKSTFFNALCNGKAVSANFPFCTIEPNIGIVPIPDERLVALQKTVRSEKVIPTTLHLVDIAGLVKGASQGEGLGNQFLANIREVDALIHVVRCFDNDDIIHVAGSIDPVFDQEIINQELRYADLATLKKKITKVEKLAKSGQKEAIKELSLLKKFIPLLEEGKDARHIALQEEEIPIVKTWHLLTIKPVLYVANVDEQTLQNNQNPHLDNLKKSLDQDQTQIIPIFIALEAQIAELSPEEQTTFLEIYELKQTSLHHLIQSAYKLLGLITYFTAGPKEVRAWTIPNGALAPQAAGVIHSDFEKNFIKAQVIKLADYLHYQTEEACKQAGKLTLEGKNYLVQDGDVIHFRCQQ